MAEPSEDTLTDDRIDAEYPLPPDRSRPVAIASAVLSAAAAVLCVVAPLQAVYTLRRVVAAQSVSVSIDGWGRYSLALPQHGPRYGLVLTLAALLLVLAAAARVASILRPRTDDVDEDATEPPAAEPPTAEPAPDAAQARTVAAGLSAAAAALVGGIWAVTGLDVNSTVSNAKGGDSHVSVGPFTWLVLAATVLGLVALALPWLEARRRRPW